MTRKENPVSRTPKAARAVSVRSPLGKSVRLELPAHSAGERPRGLPIPSVAVLGRSNVGKSSLLNALLATKVARVSQTPGRTQALHWYRVDDAFHVVDCPGYGWAKTARASRERFAGLIEELLTGERPPDLALLLVDGRLPPQPADVSMALFLRYAGVATGTWGLGPAGRVEGGTRSPVRPSSSGTNPPFLLRGMNPAASIASTSRPSVTS